MTGFHYRVRSLTSLTCSLFLLSGLLSFSTGCSDSSDGNGSNGGGGAGGEGNHSGGQSSQGGNSAPVAVVGAPHDVHDVKVGAEFMVSAAGSSDADGDTLAYQWKLVSSPESSSAMLSGSGETVRITPDVVGDYVVELVVNDGTTDSKAVRVTLSARAEAVVGSLYDKLLDFGLDAHDAHQIEDNFKADGEAAVARMVRVFSEVELTDASFAAASDPGGAVFSDPSLTDWTASTKARFTKMFGRIAFVVNSPKFEASFNKHAALLNSAYQGMPPAVPFPANYAGLSTDIQTAIADGNAEYRFFLSNQTTGTAWGIAGLKLKVERVGMMGDADASHQAWDVNGAAALVFHELMHTVGYAHDGTPADLVNLKPNNVPYLVQIIAAYESEDIVANYCGGDAACANPSLTPGNPTSLLKIYFGDN